RRGPRDPARGRGGGEPSPAPGRRSPPRGGRPSFGTPRREPEPHPDEGPDLGGDGRLVPARVDESHPVGLAGLDRPVALAHPPVKLEAEPLEGIGWDPATSP